MSCFIPCQKARFARIAATCLLSAGLLIPATGQVYWKDAKPISVNLDPGTSYGSASVDIGDGGTAVAAWVTAAELSGTDAGYDSQVMTARSEDYGNHWSLSTSISAPLHHDSPTAGIAHVTFVGQNRWFAWWKADVSDSTGFYSISDNDGLTWSTPQLFSGERVASDRQGNLLKVQNTFESPTSYGITRLQPGNTQFDEPAFVPVHPKALVHSAGNNWLLVGENNDVYASDNLGASWTPQPSDTNAPGPSGLYLTNDGSGKVAATYFSTINASQVKYQFTTSTDNGAHWSSPTIPLPAAWLPFGLASVLVESPETGKWVGIRSYGSGTLESSWSADDGQTWTPFERVASDDRPYGTNNQIATQDALAARDSHALLVWSDSNGVYFTTSKPGQPTAATDWQLYR